MMSQIGRQNTDIEVSKRGREERDRVWERATLADALVSSVKMNTERVFEL